MQQSWEGNAESRDGFLEAVHRGIQEFGKTYLSVIQSLPDKQKEFGTNWLQGIVDHIEKEAVDIFPSLTSVITGE
jgi:hypothetical protein